MIGNSASELKKDRGLSAWGLLIFLILDIAFTFAPGFFIPRNGNTEYIIALSLVYFSIISFLYFYLQRFDAFRFKPGYYSILYYSLLPFVLLLLALRASMLIFGLFILGAY